MDQSRPGRGRRAEWQKPCVRVVRDRYQSIELHSHMPFGILELALLLLAGSVLVVVIFRVLKLPALLGYLLLGIAVGPHAIGLVPDNEGMPYLAEFGIVFLMFTIGLEFNLSKLMTMRRVVFGLGAAQVLASVLLCVAVSMAFGYGWRPGIVLGGILAMSSTAILAKMLTERLEINSAHGRQIIGILLFQDLAVVPFLILFPAIAQNDDAVVRDLLVALVRAGVVLVLILTVGQKVMRGWFTLVARQKSSELL